MIFVKYLLDGDVISDVAVNAVLPHCVLGMD
jgi:hypothetical protein